MSNVVSIHPYFRAHEGKIDTFRELCQTFIERTRTEEACLFYGFSFNGDQIFCREAYVGAEGVLAHLANVGDIIEEALKHSDLERLELHGNAEELAKLKEPLAELNPAYFTYECGFVNG